MGTFSKIGALKSAARQGLAKAYYASNQFLRRLNGKVVILMYHRVLPEEKISEQFVQPGMYVRNDVFATQMEFLRDQFRILSFKELLNVWKERKIDSNVRYCVITFDDGWADNYIYAFPVLKKNNIPATIFLPTAYIGTEEWFWPDRMAYILGQYFKKPDPERENGVFHLLGRQYPRVMKRLDGQSGETIDAIIEKSKASPVDEVACFIDELIKESGVEPPKGRMVLSWKEVGEMGNTGITFGSHSRTHRILTRLNIEEVRKEIQGSLSDLQEKGVAYDEVFCYPNGEYSQEIANLVEGAGYQAAVGTNMGFTYGSDKNLFGLKRIGIHNDISATIPLFVWRLACVEASLGF